MFSVEVHGLNFSKFFDILCTFLPAVTVLLEYLNPAMFIFCLIANNHSTAEFSICDLILKNRRYTHNSTFVIKRIQKQWVKNASFRKNLCRFDHLAGR